MNEFELRAKGWTEIRPGIWAKVDIGSARLPASDAKHSQRHPLERAIPREKKSRARLKIRFRIFARRPCDWDGWHIKELQDMLVHAGILDGDDWDLLQGEVISEKVFSKDQERTEIDLC